MMFLLTAGKPSVTVTAGPTTIPVGGSVILSCSVETAAAWKYRWFRWTSNTSFVEVKPNNTQNRNMSVTQGSIYKCEAVRGKQD